MELSTKKIIAREGLVIISILSILLILFVVSQWLGKKSAELQDFGKVYELTDPITQLKFQVPATSKEHLAERIQEFEKLANPKGIPKYVEKKYGNEITIINQKKHYLDRKSIFEQLLVWIFMFSYPFYLLARFIFWAISILRLKT